MTEVEAKRQIQYQKIIITNNRYESRPVFRDLPKRCYFLYESKLYIKMGDTNAIDLQTLIVYPFSFDDPCQNVNEVRITHS